MTSLDMVVSNQSSHNESTEVSAVVDPGFPRGGGANPKGGAPTYYLVNFSRKLHENEEILGQRGGARDACPPLDPPLISDNTTHPHLVIDVKCSTSELNVVSS